MLKRSGSVSDENTQYTLEDDEYTPSKPCVSYVIFFLLGYSYKEQCHVCSNIQFLQKQTAYYANKGREPERTPGPG